MKSSVNAERLKFTFMHYERNIYLLLEDTWENVVLEETRKCLT